MSKGARRSRAGRARRQGSPNLPSYPSYIPGFAAIPVLRFFVDLFVRPTRSNWLLVLRLFGVVALALVALVEIGLLQTGGLGRWSLGAGALLLVLVALEYFGWLAARRFQKRR